MSAGWRPDRRSLLLAAAGAGTLAAVGVLGGKRLLTPAFGGPPLSAPEAYRLAAAAQIRLIDIRTPAEWAATGWGKEAIRLDMLDPGFMAALAALTLGNTSAPLALICARGVRSARLGNRLIAAGFSAVQDVPEGMLGSAVGPGWIARGLPLDRG